MGRFRKPSAKTLALLVFSLFIFMIAFNFSFQVYARSQHQAQEETLNPVAQYLRENYGVSSIDELRLKLEAEAHQKYVSQIEGLTDDPSTLEMANSWKASSGTATDLNSQVPVAESKPTVNVWKLHDSSDVPKQADSQSVTKLLQPTVLLNNVDSMVTVLSFGGLGALGMFLSPFLKGRKRTKLVALVFALTFIAFASGIFIGVRWVQDYATPGNIVKEASYVILIDGSTVKAVNGTTGAVDYSGSDAATVINNAINALTSGGKIFIKAGTYTLSSRIMINSGIGVFGEGYATHLKSVAGATFDVLTNRNAYDPAGNSNITIANLRVEGSTPTLPTDNHCIVLGYCTDSLVYGVWGINGADGIKVSQSTGVVISNFVAYGNLDSGIEIETGSNCAIVNSVARNNTGKNISANDQDDCVIAGNTVYDGDGTGISVDSLSTNIAVVGNDVRNNAKDGIVVSGSYILVSGNVLNTNGLTGGMQSGIYVTGGQNLIEANQVYNNTYTGIYVGGGANDVLVVGNIVVGGGRNGLVASSAGDRISFSNNVVRNPGRTGIYIGGTGSFDDYIISGNLISGAPSGYSGIYLTGDTNTASIKGNKCTANARYGIEIADANCSDNIVMSNNLKGNTLGAILDGGTGTILPTIVVPFVNGTLFLSADAAPWGWEIDASAEYAIATGHLPAEVQQVVRWKIWAVALVTEADKMRLEIVGRGGSDSEAYTAESVDVANKASTSSNFAANDIIYWTLTSTDDDVDDFVGGDAIMIKVLYEDAGDRDCATDAAFLCVEIEYV